MHKSLRLKGPIMSKAKIPPKSCSIAYGSCATNTRAGNNLLHIFRQNILLSCVLIMRVVNGDDQ